MASTKFFDDQKKQQRKFKRDSKDEEGEDGEKAAEKAKPERIYPLYDEKFVDDTLMDNFKHFYPDVKDKGDI